MTDEHRLLSRLFSVYDRNTRPVKNASHPVEVKLGITLTQIFDVVRIDQHIVTEKSLNNF